MTRVGVVIPAWNEASRIGAAIASAWDAGADEVIVVDGGSTDGTPEAVLPPARVLRAPRGRSRQIQAGVEASDAEVLLVLHADSALPAGACDDVRAAVARGAVGGAFHKRFDSSHPLLRGVRWRTRLWWAVGLSFGDQAQFATRDAWRRLGLRHDVIAEDMDLARRLRRAGPCVLLPSEVVTSARRLESAGVLRTWARWWLVALLQLGRELVSSGPRGGRGWSGSA